MKLLAQFVRRVSVPLLAGTLLASAAWAQKDEKFPNRTIKIIVPFTPGGTTDVMARAIGQKLNDYWGQPVIVENKPGAGGTIGTDYVAKQPAEEGGEGYDLHFATGEGTRNGVPTTVTVRVREPDGTETLYTSPVASIVNSSTGVWAFTFPAALDAAGDDGLEAYSPENVL